MTISEAIEILDQRNEEARILNRRTGEYGTISPSVRAGLISSAQSALRAATGRSDVQDVNILPFANSLADHAYGDAEEKGHVNPANAADRVRRFLAIVEGREYQKARGGVAYLPSAWRELYEAARDLGNNYAPRIAALCRVAIAPKENGGNPVLDPVDLPPRGTVRKWLRNSGFNGRRPGRIIRAYQLSREALPEERRRRLPALTDHEPAGGRNLCSLPHLPELLSGTGVSPTKFRHLSALDRIRVVAEEVHYGLTAYLDANEHRSSGWHKAAIGGVERVLAAMEASGYSLDTHDPLDLYTQTVNLARSGSEKAKAQNPLLARRYGPDHATEADETAYLVRMVAETAGRASFAASPYEPVHPDNDGTDDTGVTHYTATMQRDFRHFHEMCRVAYAAVESINPTEWAMMEVVQSDLLKHMQTVNSTNRVTGQKRKEELLDLITLPQVVCIGLPALRAHVLRLREAYHIALCDHLGAEVPKVIQSRRRYAKLLRDYLRTAIMISDGLRVQNYTGARLGIHLVPEPSRGAEGEQHRFRHVTTHWRGYDVENVRLKIDEDELKRERKRSWRLLPGIVDLELLYEYLFDVRLDRLVSAGLLPSTEAYDPAEDLDQHHFAVFPSGHSSSVERFGCYASTRSISRSFGRSLHWMATRVLGRELPEWNSRELQEEYRALWSAHVSRLLLGTYWGGVRDEWLKACMLTDDTEQTLRKSYMKVGATLIERMSDDDWSNPHHFDTEMDRIWAGEVIDWDTHPRGLHRQLLASNQMQG